MAKLRNAFVFKMTSALLLLGIFLFTGCSTVPDYSYSSYRQGKADAQRDINANILAIEVYGFGASNDSEWGRLLQQRYGIEQRVVAGCIVNEKITGHAKGYNEVSHQEIERRLGSDIWTKIRADETAFHQSKPPVTVITK